MTAAASDATGPRPATGPAASLTVPARDTGPAGHSSTTPDLTRTLPSAAIPLELTAAAVREYFGLEGEFARLPGEADDNFLLTTPAGRRYIVKIAHERADPRAAAVQARLLAHIAAADPLLPVPRLISARTKEPYIYPENGPLGGRAVQVLSHLGGRPWRSVRPAPALRFRLGSALAALGLAMAGFDDPLLRQPMLWDLAHLAELRPLVAQLPPGRTAGLLSELLDRFAVTAGPRLPGLRAQVAHNDYSLDNVLVSGARGRVTGIIDFGDAAVTALVADLAIAAAYALADRPGPLDPAMDLIAGYHAVAPLTAAEISLLPELIIARLTARLIIPHWRAARFPENAPYILRNTAAARAHLDRMLAVPAGDLAARIAAACDRPRLTRQSDQRAPEAPSA